MTLRHLRLFKSAYEAFVVFGILVVIFLVNVGYIYYSYDKFISSRGVHEGVVALAYGKVSKKGKPYQVAKIVTKDFTLYTTFWKKSKYVKSNDGVKFKIFSKHVTFLDFFSKKFYAPVYHVKTKKIESVKKDIENFIKSQHKNPQMGELYCALFLASPISKNVRQSVQKWGISHLVAISGFHLGVIYGSLFFLFRFMYGFFQNRYFPYRNINFDLGILIFILLGFYLYLIDFAPSFLRAYVMGILGFIFYQRYFKVLSFFNLALAICLILAFFPSLVLSIGFWLSVMGVYFIFLYFHHFSFKWWDLLFINIWVFLALNIPVHVWFGYTSFGQFGAIILSILFVPFYPLAFLLHVAGFGDLMDKILENLFSISFKGGDVITPFWVLLGYVVLSIASIFNRYLAIFTVSLGLIYFFII